MKSCKLKYIFFFVISIISIKSIYMCAVTTQPSGYEKLFLLPLTFTTGFLIFFNVVFSSKEDLTDNIPYILVILLGFVRNVITPMYMITDSYVSSLGWVNPQNVEKAIYLVAYETIAIYVYIVLSRYVRMFNFKIKPNIKHSTGVFNVIFLCMVVVSGLALILIPAFRTQFYTIFTSDITHIVQEEAEYNVGSILRILATLGEVCIGAIRIILPTYFIYKCALNGQNAKNLILSLFCVFAQCIFMTDSNAYILMLMISQVLLVCRLFPKYYKKIFKILVFLTVGFFVVLYRNRFMQDHYANSTSLFLQSYLPSVSNASGIFNIGVSNKLSQLFVDIFIAIPFKSSFGYNGGLISTNLLWQKINDCKGQIMPMVAGSYYYFGFWLSPVMSCFCISIANRLNKKLKCEQNVMLYSVYIYFMIYSAATPFVYNSCIYFQCFLQRVIFMIIPALFSTFKFSDIMHLRQTEDVNYR